MKMSRTPCTWGIVENILIRSPMRVIIALYEIKFTRIASIYSRHTHNFLCVENTGMLL